MKEAKQKGLPQDQTRKPEIQGEGDYDAARRHRDSVAEFLDAKDPEQLARAAAPRDPQESKELEEAEQRGRERSPTTTNVADAKERPEQPSRR